MSLSNLYLPSPSPSHLFAQILVWDVNLVAGLLNWLGHFHLFWHIWWHGMSLESTQDKVLFLLAEYGVVAMRGSRGPSYLGLVVLRKG